MIHKAVLLSIHSQWVTPILHGTKTIEVRKSRPKCEVPFKCYIYCTKAIHSAYAGGKVVGEFVCDNMLPIDVQDNGIIRGLDFKEIKATGLLYSALSGYIGKGSRGYGWHISDLHTYVAPLDLSTFRRPCPHDQYCESCAMYAGRAELCGNSALKIAKPPQSWCYVEEA